MSDAGFNDELLDKELFGGDSDDLDGTGMDVDEIIGMGDSVAGPATTARGLGGIGASVSHQNGASAETESLAKDADSMGLAQGILRGEPGAGISQQQQSPELPKLVDIEMDNPPGNITVLTHAPHVRPTPPPELTSCTTYDILPTMLFVNSYQIHAAAATANMRWVFTGGEDGYIRKWDVDASAAGKQLLTQGQRHSHVDSISKAGVLASYWDHNDKAEEDSMDVLSPVYSIAVQSQAEWLVSGMKSGHIGLWTVRHDEGRRIALLAKHKKPVSVLRITPDEFGLVSGSWDRAVLYWDLNTGKIARAFAGHVSQISSVEFRPTWSPDQFAALSASENVAVKDSDGDDDDGDDDGSSSNGSEKNNAPKENGSNANNGQTFDAKTTSPVLLTTSIDGQCYLWDVRAPHTLPHGLNATAKTPRWATSACWSTGGSSIFVGRRNNTIDEYDFAMLGAEPLRTLRLPMNSGPVTSLAAMPNGRSLVCASTDNVRMWSLDHQSDSSRDAVPFQIVPGHHGSTVSSILIDESARYMLTTSGNRGWEGTSNNVFLGYEISPLNI
ncbi:Transcription factor spt8 [Coemansia sp. RSA 1813]|nr:Transcription factor spt8 [Coemansia sp. RSA 1646]KAJ1767603.1 Transcription factor spt8 [Coemansia sp. RSA 1843]KAJ2093004.1 Transcription factor spt8 [Coemansia sp. RSA 986]KAJ2214088.1 Transcription factor spt8 [Coemansia sp. RSA 487]KAJ2569112.1 Transcription factor spt8 [Coemansia sp. RSA 1813]